MTSRSEVKTKGMPVAFTNDQEEENIQLLMRDSEPLPSYDSAAPAPASAPAPAPGRHGTTDKSHCQGKPNSTSGSTGSNKRARIMQQHQPEQCTTGALCTAGNRQDLVGTTIKARSQNARQMRCSDIPTVRIRGGGGPSSSTASSDDNDDNVVQMALSLSVIWEKENKSWSRESLRKTDTFQEGININKAMMEVARERVQGIEAAEGTLPTTKGSDNVVAVRVSVAVHWSSRHVIFHRKPYLHTSFENAVRICQDLLQTFESATKEVQPGKQLAAIQGLMEELESQVTKAATSTRDLEAKLKSLRDSVEDNTTPSPGKDSITKGLANQLDSLQTRVGNLQSELSSTNQFSADLEEQVDQAVPKSKDAVVGAQLKNVKSRMDDLQEQLDRTNRASSNLEQRLEEFNTSILAKQEAEDETDEAVATSRSAPLSPLPETNNAPKTAAEDFTSAFSALSTPKPKGKTQEEEEFSIDSSSMSQVSSVATSAVSKNDASVTDPTSTRTAQQERGVAPGGETDAKARSMLVEDDSDSDPDSDEETTMSLPSLASSVSAKSYRKLWNNKAAPQDAAAPAPLIEADDDGEENDRVGDFTQVFSALSSPKKQQGAKQQSDIDSVDSSILSVPSASYRSELSSPPREQDKIAAQPKSPPGSEEKSNKPQIRDEPAPARQSQTKTKQEEKGGQGEKPSGRADDFTAAFSALEKPAGPRKTDRDAVDSIDSSAPSVSTAKYDSEQEKELPTSVDKNQILLTPKTCERSGHSDASQNDKAVQAKKSTPKQPPVSKNISAGDPSNKADDFTNAFSALNSPQKASNKARQEDDSIDSSIDTIASASTYQSSLAQKAEGLIPVPENDEAKIDPKQDQGTAQANTNRNLQPSMKADDSPPVAPANKADDFTKACSALNSPVPQNQQTDDENSGIDSSVGSIPTVSDSTQLEEDKPSTETKPNQTSSPSISPKTFAATEQPRSGAQTPVASGSGKADDFAQAFSALNSPKATVKPEEADDSIDSSANSTQDSTSKSAAKEAQPAVPGKADDFTKAFSALNTPKIQNEVEDESEGIDSSVTSIPSASFRSDPEIEHGKVSMPAPSMQVKSQPGEKEESRVEERKNETTKKVNKFTESFSAVNVPGPKTTSSNEKDGIDYEMESVMSALTTDKEISSLVHQDTKTRSTTDKTKSSQAKAPEKAKEFTKAFSALNTPKDSAKNDDRSVDIDSTSRSIPSDLKSATQITETKSPKKADDFTKAFSALNTPRTHAKKDDESDAIDSSVGTVPSASFRSSDDSQKGGISVTSQANKKAPGKAGDLDFSQGRSLATSSDASRSTGLLALATAAGQEEAAFGSRSASLADKIEALERKLQVEQQMVGNAEKMIVSLRRVHEIEDDSILTSVVNDGYNSSVDEKGDDESVALSVEDISVMSGASAVSSSSDGATSEEELLQELDPPYLDEDSSHQVDEESEPERQLDQPTKKWSPVKTSAKRTPDKVPLIDEVKKEPKNVAKPPPPTKKAVTKGKKGSTGKNTEADDTSVASSEIQPAVAKGAVPSTQKKTVAASTDESPDTSTPSISRVLPKEAEAYVKKEYLDDDSCSTELSLESLSDSSEDLYQEEAAQAMSEQPSATPGDTSDLAASIPESDDTQSDGMKDKPSISDAKAAKTTRGAPPASMPEPGKGSASVNTSEAFHIMVDGESQSDSGTSESEMRNRKKQSDDTPKADLADSISEASSQAKMSSVASSDTSSADFSAKASISKPDLVADDKANDSLHDGEAASSAVSSAVSSEIGSKPGVGADSETNNTLSTDKDATKVLEETSVESSDPANKAQGGFGLDTSSDDESSSILGKKKGAEEKLPSTAQALSKEPTTVLGGATTTSSKNKASDESSEAESSSEVATSEEDGSSSKPKRRESLLSNPTEDDRKVSSDIEQDNALAFSEGADAALDKTLNIGDGIANAEASSVLDNAPRPESSTFGDEKDATVPRNFLDEFTKDPDGFKPDTEEDYKEESLESSGSNVSVVSVDSELTESTGDFDREEELEGPEGEEVRPKEEFAKAFSPVAATSKSSAGDDASVSVDSGKISLSESVGVISAASHNDQQVFRIRPGSSLQEEKMNEDLGRLVLVVNNKRPPADKDHPFDEPSDITPGQENRALGSNQPRSTRPLVGKSTPSGAIHLQLSSFGSDAIMTGPIGSTEKPVLGKLSNVNDAFERLNRIKDRLRGLRLLMDTKDLPATGEGRGHVPQMAAFGAGEDLTLTGAALADFSRQLQTASEAPAQQDPSKPSPIDEAYEALMRAQSKLRSLRALTKARDAGLPHELY